MADDLGAHWHEIVRDDPARALVDFATEHQVTQIVLGSSRRSRWEEMTKGSVVQRVLRFASDSGVDVHVIARRDDDAGPGRGPLLMAGRPLSDVVDAVEEAFDHPSGPAGDPAVLVAQGRR